MFNSQHAAPLVSVIIPAYRHKRYVQGCIQAVIDQTYQNIELIVIDDGSPDQTWAKLQAMLPACERRFVRVSMETQQNAGISATLERLVARANGDYITLCASDDLLKPQAIEREVAFLSQHPDYVLAVGDNEIVDSDGRRIGWGEAQEESSLENATYHTFGEFLEIRNLGERFDSYEALIAQNHVPNGYTISMAAIRRIPQLFTPEAPLEDWFMMLQLAKIGKFAYLDEILFSYRWHTTNTIQNSVRTTYVRAKTFDYEETCVNRLADGHWAALLRKYGYAKKTIVSLGPIFGLYKVTSPSEKMRILKLFGCSLAFRRCNVLQKCTEAFKKMSANS